MGPQPCIERKHGRVPALALGAALTPAGGGGHLRYGEQPPGLGVGENVEGSCRIARGHCKARAPPPAARYVVPPLPVGPSHEGPQLGTMRLQGVAEGH